MHTAWAERSEEEGGCPVVGMGQEEASTNDSVGFERTNSGSATPPANTQEKIESIFSFQR